MGAPSILPPSRPHAVALVTHLEVVFQQHSYTRNRAVSPVSPVARGSTRFCSVVAPPDSPPNQAMKGQWSPGMPSSKTKRGVLPGPGDARW